MEDVHVWASVQREAATRCTGVNRPPANLHTPKPTCRLLDGLEFPSTKLLHFIRRVYLAATVSKRKNSLPVSLDEKASRKRASSSRFFFFFCSFSPFKIHVSRTEHTECAVKLPSMTKSCVKLKFFDALHGGAEAKDFNGTSFVFEKGAVFLRGDKEKLLWCRTIILLRDILYIGNVLYRPVKLGCGTFFLSPLRGVPRFRGSDGHWNSRPLTPPSREYFMLLT